MIAVVLDSNIYISALLFGGNPRAVIELAQDGRFQILSSRSIQMEVERVLGEKFSWSVRRIETATSRLWGLTRLISSNEVISDCIDPDDNRILECAVGGSAEAVVTGDGHLLRLDPYRGIAIVTAKRFLDETLWR